MSQVAVRLKACVVDGTSGSGITVSDDPAVML
jgi:hypothetical protein